MFDSSGWPPSTIKTTSLRTNELNHTRLHIFGQNNYRPAREAVLYVVAHKENIFLLQRGDDYVGCVVSGQTIYEQGTAIEFRKKHAALRKTSQAMQRTLIANPGRLERHAILVLVLELLTPGEAHFGEQAPQLCATMMRARPAKIENADRSSLESRPADVVRPVLEFLQTNR